MSDAKPEAGEGRAKRQRKQPEAFKPEVKVQQEFVIKAGRGIKLSDIPNVKFKLSKHKADEDVVVDLHRALYQRTGTAIKRKRDILDFSGFVWDGDEEKEKAKTLERLNKLKVDVLTQMCDIFEVTKEGKKEHKAARLLEFLLTPKANSDKDLAALEAKKKEAKKRQREKTKTKTTAAKSKGKKKAKKESSDDDDDDEEEEEEEEEVEEEEEAEEGDEEKEEPKKDANKGSKKEAKTEGKKAEKSRKKADKKDTQGDEEQGQDDKADEQEGGEKVTKDGEEEQGEGKADNEGKEQQEAEEEEEEEPKSKKAKQVPKAKGKGGKGATKDVEAAGAAKAEDGSLASPSDDELKQAVCSIVAGVDAASYSFKNLMVDLEAKFPTAKFSSARKKLIKAWLVELITPPEAQPAGEEKPEGAAEEKKDV